MQKEILEETIVSILEEELGNYTKRTKQGEYTFRCPFCSHRKPKLDVNVLLNAWHCWICTKKGALPELLKLVKAPATSIKQVEAAYKKKTTTQTPNRTVQPLTLPKNFVRLSTPRSDPDFVRALKYVINVRGIKPRDILRYNIGYCDSGQYGGMIIIPSYDSSMRLNFFTGRSITTKRHKIPKVSKDVVGFEYLIDWNFPVNIVESPLDAIVTGSNSIPLYGKTIQNNVKKAIIANKVKRVNLILDPDAFVNSLDAAEYFMNNGVDVHLVRLTDGDPNELGYTKISTLIEQSKPLEFCNLLEYKFAI